MFKLQLIFFLYFQYHNFPRVIFYTLCFQTQIFRIIQNSEQQSLHYTTMIDQQVNVSQYGLCPKHREPAIYICSVDTCNQHRLICQICKQQETLHFSHHANYIYRIKQFKEFQTSKETISRLEKGLKDCQNNVGGYKKAFNEQLVCIKGDFESIKREFCTMADKYEKIYINAFEKEMEKYDEKIQEIKQILKEYTKQRDHQDSFFTMLFHGKKDENSLEKIITKNYKAFKVRAQIISLRSKIAMDKNNTVQYKKTQKEIVKFKDLISYLINFSNDFFDKFKVLLGDSPKSDGESLRNSIVSESKSLAMSRVSTGSLLQIQDLSKSRASSSAEISFQRVQLPNPHPKVAQLRDKLLEMRPPQKAVLEGPYPYSNGVYYGQMSQNMKHGFGTFIFKDGTLYQGGWENDVISGYGRIIKKNSFYEGQVRNGRANGKGNYEDQYRTYTGQWKDDKRCGLGEEEFKIKRKKYVGLFQNDRYNGKGKLFDEEYVYDGKFKNGLFHGEGVINFRNRQSFHGTFQEGLKNFGRYTYPDGSYYDGTFADNMPNGTGEFFWPDGVRYSGQWKNGVQDGVGTQILQDGKSMRGVWRNGRWQKWI